MNNVLFHVCRNRVKYPLSLRKRHKVFLNSATMNSRIAAFVLFLMMGGLGASGQGMASEYIEFTIRHAWNKPFYEEKIVYEEILVDHFRDSLTVDGVSGKHYLYFKGAGHFEPYNPFGIRYATVEDLIVDGDSVYLMFISSNWQDTGLALFYDFSLQVGDSFPIFRTNPPDTVATIYRVTYRDSMTMLDGSKHTSLKLVSPMSDTLTWIKGIGSLEYGFNMSRQTYFETGYEVLTLCVGESTEKALYKKWIDKAHVDSSCVWPAILAVEQTINNKSVQLINERHGAVRAKLSSAGAPWSICIYDLSGKLLSRETHIEQDWVMESHKFQTGLYILHLEDRYGHTTIQRIRN